MQFYVCLYKLMELKSFSPERLFIKVLVLDFLGCVFFYHEINESFISSEVATADDQSKYFNEDKEEAGKHYILDFYLKTYPCSLSTYKIWRTVFVSLDLFNLTDGEHQGSTHSDRIARTNSDVCGRRISGRRLGIRRVKRNRCSFNGHFYNHKAGVVFREL